MYPVVDAGQKRGIPEHVFRVVKTYDEDKYIIMTQEEWIQLRSYSDNYFMIEHLSTKYNFNLNSNNTFIDFKLNEYLPEFISLLNYTTDKPINNTTHLIFMIENLLYNIVDPTRIDKAIYNFISYIYTVESYKTEGDSFESKLITNMNNFILMKFYAPHFMLITHSNYILDSLNFINEDTGTVDNTKLTPDEEKVFKKLLAQIITENKLIETIDKGIKLDIDYKDENFNSKTIKFVKKIFENIDHSIATKSYINGLLIDTLNINSENLMPKETQQSIYKDIINKLLP
jgi:hypothetical protein